MLEAQAIGEKLGVRFGVDVEKRIDGGAAVGTHKTSMLQDPEAGRTMKIDALPGAVKELGQLVNVATPVIDMVLTLVQQRARVAGCYQAVLLFEAGALPSAPGKKLNVPITGNIRPL